MIYALVLILGLAAGALSGIIGTGSSIMLLPVLVLDGLLLCSGVALLFAALA